jgi:hypothetical protein
VVARNEHQRDVEPVDEIAKVVEGQVSARDDQFDAAESAGVQEQVVIDLVRDSKDARHACIVPTDAACTLILG